MKKLLIPFILLIGCTGCATSETSVSCLNQALAIEVAATTSDQDTDILLKNKVISKSVAQTVLNSSHTATSFAETAKTVCATNPATAAQYISDALALLATAKTLKGE